MTDNRTYSVWQDWDDGIKREVWDENGSQVDLECASAEYINTVEAERDHWRTMFDDREARTHELKTDLRKAQAITDQALRLSQRRGSERDSLRSQLKAVDDALPTWEPAEGEYAVGRVQTILNLVEDRWKLEGLRK